MSTLLHKGLMKRLDRLSVDKLWDLADALNVDPERLPYAEYASRARPNAVVAARLRSAIRSDLRAEARTEPPAESRTEEAPDA